MSALETFKQCAIALARNAWGEIFRRDRGIGVIVVCLRAGDGLIGIGSANINPEKIISVLRIAANSADESGVPFERVLLEEPS